MVGNCHACGRLAGGVVEMGDGAVLCQTCAKRRTDRSRENRILALEAYALARHRTRQLREESANRESRAGDALGNLMAIDGAVSDNPYEFSAGLAIRAEGRQRAANIRGTHDRVKTPEPVMSEMLRMFVLQGGKVLNRQPIYWQKTTQRFVAQVVDAFHTDTEIMGTVILKHKSGEFSFVVRLNEQRGMWEVLPF